MGIDLIMSVNDLSTRCYLFIFYDTLSINKIDLSKLKSIISVNTDGCLSSLVGG